MAGVAFTPPMVSCACVSYLAEQRRLVDALRTRDDPRLAEELVALCEIEPLFDHGAPRAHVLLAEAARRLDGVPPGELHGRLLIRLGATQIAAGKYDDADASLERGIARLVGGHPGRIEAAALAVRTATRRGARQRAAEMVPGLISFLGATPAATAERRAVLTVAACVAELMFESDGDRAEAIAMFKDLLAAVDGDDRLLDLAFLARHALATGELLEASDGALGHLRAIVQMTREVGAIADEIHARIALGGMLTEKGDRISVEEAGRHLQIARDRALEARVDDLHMLALIGQAGYLARRGRIHGALDRCLEIARSAVASQDVVRYVGAVVLMSTLYEVRGDLPSAIRALIEAEHGLGERIGIESARKLFRPYLHTLADRIGRERFIDLLEKINAAQEIELENH